MKGNAVVTFGFRRRLAVLSGRVVFMSQLERREARRSPPLANERPFLAVPRRGHAQVGNGFSSALSDSVAKTELFLGLLNQACA